MTKNKGKLLIIYFLTLGGVVIWISAILLAPYLKSKSIILNVYVYTIFSSICHQIPSRSFFLFGYPLAVCVRCFGIYSGFFSGVLFYPVLKSFSSTSLPQVKAFIFLSFPVVFDTIGNFIRLWSTPNIPRFFTGFLWGLILPFYFIAGITDLALKLRNNNYESDQ